MWYTIKYVHIQAAYRLDVKYFYNFYKYILNCLFQGWSNGNIEYVPFSYSGKSKHESEVIETSLFKVNQSKHNITTSFLKSVYWFKLKHAVNFFLCVFN